MEAKRSARRKAAAKKAGQGSKTSKARISKLLQKAMTQFEQRLQKEDLKPTVGDYLKLIQIEKELDEDETKEIKVTWVEPGEASEPEE